MSNQRCVPAENLYIVDMYTYGPAVVASLSVVTLLLTFECRRI